MGDVRQDSSIQIHVWDSPSDYIEWTGSLDAVVRQTLSMQERQAAAADADAMACLSPEADCAELLLRGAIEVVHQSDPRGINQWRVDVLTCALQLHTTETTTADVDKMYPEPIPGPQDCRAVVQYFCEKHLQEFGGIGYAKKASWLKAHTIYTFSVGTIQKHAKDRHEWYFNYARNQREAMPVVDESETVLTESQTRERSQTNQEMVDAAQLPIHNTKNRRRSDMTQQEYLAESPESQALIDEADELLNGKKSA